MGGVCYNPNTLGDRIYQVVQDAGSSPAISQKISERLEKIGNTNEG